MIKKFFYEIAKIPHASFQEANISNYLVDFANQRGLRVIQDEKKNVIIFKKASAGYEDHPVVMLQGHMDMVAEKNQDSQHDFENDPIEIIEKEDGWLYANKTTLGADDGAGMAYMLAILDDTSLNHPALECVFTVEEEVGMGGAHHLDTSVLNATRLIGLDSGGEHLIAISSTGGNRGEVSYSFKYERTHKDQLHIKVRGLKGGHSGLEIDQERGNALKIAGKLLYHLLQEFNVGFSTIEGGLKDNAIMRECDLILGIKEENIEAIEERIRQLEAEYQATYKFSDEDLRIDYEITHKDCYSTSLDTTRELAQLLTLIPYGYFSKSMVIDDLVTASCNIGRVWTDENKVYLGLSMRSPQAFVLKEINQQVEIITELTSAHVEFSGGYPGWEYEPESYLRTIINETYKELHHGEEMTLEATHGGLELGVWAAKMPGIDIAAFGPIMEDIHTPDERLNIDSFYRVYHHLIKTLEKL